MHKLNPQPLPLLVRCDIHPWVSARVFVFDHPYSAITKADGSFAIPRVPAGAEVTVLPWHEGVGEVLGKDGKPQTLQAGEHDFNFTIEARKR